MSQVYSTYFNPDNILLAFHRVRRWSERLAKDRYGIHAFEENLEDNCLDLSKRILQGDYQPSRGFKYYEAKSSGTLRSKTLLYIEDALVYQAMANVIAQRVYPQLAETEMFVYGSILSPDVSKGVELLKEENPNYFFLKPWKSLYGKFRDSVIKAIEEDKATHKFETDITGFFDSIPHYNLFMTMSREFQVEDEILDLMGECLSVWSGTKESSTPGVGIPQGPQPSFFLANLLLHPLDHQMIGEAFKFYRYMDDIHIYAYSREDLQDVLVKIDCYLKGHGLSINSKKTRIEAIDPNIPDATVAKLKKFNDLVTGYESTDIEPDEKPKNDVKERIARGISGLFDQSDDPDPGFGFQRITDPAEAIALWEMELAQVERELPKLFTTINGEVTLKEPTNVEDVDFIKFSAQYGTAIKALKDLKPTEANPELLKYWLFALKNYFWRADKLLITLQHYKNQPLLKDTLWQLYRYGKNYESYRYHLVSCLNYNFEHSDRELRDAYKTLVDERSHLVRYALYCLLVRNSKDGQMLATLKASLAREAEPYVKMLVLEFWNSKGKGVDSMEELIKSVGL